MNRIWQSADQPELINKPNILYDWQNDKFDARWIPKIWNLWEKYQSWYERLFFALDKCYFINDEPYRIKAEEWEVIHFEHTTKIWEIISYTRDEIKELSKFGIPHFWYWIRWDLQHKLEIGQLSLQDKETKDTILEWYHNTFDKLKPWQYPHSQWTINSLFFISIALDLDKDIQKKLAKYFINNVLNTLYYEKEGDYGLRKLYSVQEVWKKIGLDIQPLHHENDTYISPEDCKKIADRAWITDQEFSEVLYESCLFKFGDESKSAVSFHRRRKFLIDEIIPYLLSPHKENVENFQYILEHWRDNHTQMMYDIKPYHIIKANEVLWVSLQEQKDKIENDKMTYQKIWHHTVKNIWQDTFDLYTHKRDVNIDKYTNYTFTDLFLVAQWDTISLTDVNVWKEVLWSVKVHFLYHKGYDHQNNRSLFHGSNKKYEINIFSSPNMPREYIYTILEIFKTQFNIETNLKSLDFDCNK